MREHRKFEFDNRDEIFRFLENKNIYFKKEIDIFIEQSKLNNFELRNKKISNSLETKLLYGLKSFFYEEKFEITIIKTNENTKYQNNSYNYLEIHTNVDDYYWNNIKDLEDIIKEINGYDELKKNAKSLKDTYKLPTILNEKTAAGIIHEAVGHSCEATYISHDLKKYFHENNGFPKNITIIDDPTIENLSGSYLFDDEGNNAKKNYIFYKGKFINFIGSSEFTNTGNGRCINYTNPCITRMSNTYLDKGNFSDKELFKDFDNGIYVLEVGAGGFFGLNFEMEIKLGIIFENGKKQYFKDALITTNTIDFLNSISKIGNRVKINSIECNAFGQWFYQISAGSPKILLNNLKIMPLKG